MTINFEVEDINEGRTNYKLDTNVLRGFKNSVKYSQNIQAMNYLELVIDKLVEHINGAPVVIEDDKPLVEKPGRVKPKSATAEE